MVLICNASNLPIAVGASSWQSALAHSRVPWPTAECPGPQQSARAHSSPRGHPLAQGHTPLARQSTSAAPWLALRCQGRQPTAAGESPA